MGKREKKETKRFLLHCCINWVAIKNILVIIKNIHSKRSPGYLLSALNSAIRCSEISSSTEDSSFRSPSIIQGVWGKFLEYLLYLPVKSKYVTYNYSKAMDKSFSLPYHNSFNFHRSIMKINILIFAHTCSIPNSCSWTYKSFSIQDSQLKGRLGEPTAAVKPSGKTTETELYEAWHNWEWKRGGPHTQSE